jgi:hypothetical protein
VPPPEPCVNLTCPVPALPVRASRRCRSPRRASAGHRGRRRPRSTAADRRHSGTSTITVWASACLTALVSASWAMRVGDRLDVRRQPCGAERDEHARQQACGLGEQRQGKGPTRLHRRPGSDWLRSAPQSARASKKKRRRRSSSRAESGRRWTWLILSSRYRIPTRGTAARPVDVACGCRVSETRERTRAARATRPDVAQSGSPGALVGHVGDPRRVWCAGRKRRSTDKIIGRRGPGHADRRAPSLCG